jgi:predicted nucleic acid-binding protein
VILVDTSVWIDHLRNRNDRVAALLEDGGVCSHPFIVGELACGNLKNRVEILELFSHLPEATVAAHGEVLHLVEEHRLMVTGPGWVDAHLPAAAMLTEVVLWTGDLRLNRIAARLGIAG